jgi:hypothetical protein
MECCFIVLNYAYYSGLVAQGTFNMVKRELRRTLDHYVLQPLNLELDNNNSCWYVLNQGIQSSLTPPDKLSQCPITCFSAVPLKYVLIKRC